MSLSDIAITYLLSPATTTPVQTQTIAPSLTNWQKSFNFNKFDPSLGKLDGINVTIVGRVTTSLSVENLGAAGTIRGLTTTSFILNAAPGGNVVTNVTTASVGGSLAAFDGTIDNAGQSGLVSQTSITSTNGDFGFGTSLFDDADLAAFAGLGTIDLSLVATALGTVSGVRQGPKTIESDDTTRPVTSLRGIPARSRSG